MNGFHPLHNTSTLSVLAPTPQSPFISLLLYACPPSLQLLSPFPSPIGEAGDMQALANLNGFAKQYLRLHVSQCWF